MKIDKVVLSNFRCFPEEKTIIDLEDDITCLVGNNGSGKTAFVLALKRLFGSTIEDRTIIKDDFYVNTSESKSDICGRKLYIEIEFSFAELRKSIQEARTTCPAFSSVIYSDTNTHSFKARMRLEAIWDETEYEDDVQSQIYWITTSDDIEFGEESEFKHSVSSQDRKYIRLRYIPAFRDSKSTLRNEIKVLTKTLEEYTSIELENQIKIEEISQNLSQEIQSLDSIKTSTALIQKIWSQTHDETLTHYQQPRLESVPTEVGELLKSISIKLYPSEWDECRDIDELSDGQVSLLYFTLSLALYELEQKHHAGKAKGFKPYDKNIAIFTIFAFEEPENHLSPYYLGRILNLLSKTCETNKAIGIVTSHSSCVVQRMRRVEQIRHFRQENNSQYRYSIVKKILIHAERTADDYKYINQAILAHPELYFSKLVVLGEGDSEEIVIPQLAKKLGFDLDPSFVAFVKLGGRHVNHMWRLLSDLNIPYVTLVDLDLGRSGGGNQRIKNIIETTNKQSEIIASCQEATSESTTESEKMKLILGKLEEENIYFSLPIDLDMAMIQSFSSYYEAENARNSDRSILEKAVFGTEGNSIDCEKYGFNFSDEILKKYRNLFLTGSKVASHYKAMANILELDDDELIRLCPDYLKRLIEKCSSLIRGSIENG